MDSNLAIAAGSVQSAPTSGAEPEQAIGARAIRERWLFRFRDFKTVADLAEGLDECGAAWINTLIDKVEEAAELLRECYTVLISSAVTGKINVQGFGLIFVVLVQRIGRLSGRSQ